MNEISYFVDMMGKKGLERKNIDYMSLLLDLVIHQEQQEQHLYRLTTRD